MQSTLALLLLLLPGQGDRDKTASAFDDWFRDYRRGTARFDQSVLAPVLRRGRADDGDRLLSVLAQDWRQEAKGERTGRAIQDRLLEALTRSDCPLGIQGAVLRRIRAGISVVSFPGEAPAWEHAEPQLVARLLPLLGVWHATRFRGLLENFVRGRDPLLVLASARTLTGMRAARSFTTIGRSLAWLADPAQVREIVAALKILLETREVAPAHSRFALDLVLHRIQDPAVPANLKEPLLVVVGEIRQERSIPILLGELDRVHRILEGKAATPTGLSFYRYALHAALQDLTGFWAPASSPDRWWTFWEQEGEGFAVRKRQPVTAPKTVAKGFFGIPVRGRRVLFVVDTSGSMRTALASGLSRLAQAKKELRTAVAGMDPMVEFNVILFADDTRRLAKSFVKPTPSNRRALDRMLDKAAADGATNLSDALCRGMAGKVRAVETPWRRSIDEIFVLSDGAPRSDPARILEDVARWNVGRAARINAVYLGSGDNAFSNLGLIPHGRSLGPIDFMRRLARDNGGVFLVPR